MNKFALRISFFFFFYCFDMFNCYAREHVSFSVALRLNVGEHREEVFTKKRLLSVLHWPVLPTVAFNLGLDFYANYFHFSNEADIGFPAIAGDMKDEDYTDAKQQKITLFSKHITDIKHHYSIRSFIGIPIPCHSSLIGEEKRFSLVLEPGIGIYFSYMNWHAREGYLQYREKIDTFSNAKGDDSHFWKPSWPKVAYNGGGITYIKKTIIPFMQFDIKLNVNQRWIFLSGLMFSPFLFAYSTDIHFDRKTFYVDNFSPTSFAFEVKTHVEWKIIRSCSVFGTFTYFMNYSKNGQTNVFNLHDEKIKASFQRGSAGITSHVGSFVLGSKFYF